MRKDVTGRWGHGSVAPGGRSGIRLSRGRRQARYRNDQTGTMHRSETWCEIDSSGPFRLMIPWAMKSPWCFAEFTQRENQSGSRTIAENMQISHKVKKYSMVVSRTFAKHREKRNFAQSFINSANGNSAKNCISPIPSGPVGDAVRGGSDASECASCASHAHVHQSQMDEIESVIFGSCVQKR